MPEQGRRPQARTRLARRTTIDTARALFLERGYHATTVEAISNVADVPQATIYRLFASKQGILKAVLDTSIVGDDEPVPVASRPHVLQLLAGPDPRDQLAGLAAISVDINQRVAPILRMLASAADSDPDAAALLDDLAQQRRAGQSRLATALGRSGALRSGLRLADATDIIHALASPELYRLLVFERGWPPEKYQRWLAGTLTDQLLVENP
ncbi:MAG: helix-turn-helix transcriptional regulator [Acidimicrobiales bacterium]|nr:helix-turn-helix transcriptional regulator [Acidimicrobiales bacterium]